MLQLLGDELIATDRLAVFELVKNAYDADANKAIVTLNLNGEDDPSILVRDDGSGMTLDDIQNVWLVPGDEHRKKQREEGRRTPRHGRLPLGEKGLGRFAVHKLGNSIQLVTRAIDAQECVVEIDWHKIITQPFLDQAPVTIKIRRPEVFKGEDTGTQILVSQLRSSWRRGEVRRLHNQITSMCSPFEDQSSFQAELQAPGNDHWLAGLPDVKTILGRAFWHFSFAFDRGEFNWDYEFRKVPGLNLDGRIKRQEQGKLRLPKPRGQGRSASKIVADDSTTNEIGPIKGEFYVYDRDRKILGRMLHQQALTGYLDEAGGIRVYRDGIRVYNYGEQGDDWLGLDLRRVNSPTRRISRNIILGAIHLSLQDSSGLIEKTNREGFVENDAFERLKNVVIGIIEAFESERFPDKDRMRQLDYPQVGLSSSGIDKLIDQTLSRLRQLRVKDDTIELRLQRIREYHHKMQESLLSAGISGLNLAVIFHEVERGVRTLYESLKRGADPDDLLNRAGGLAQTLDGFSTLLRRTNTDKHTARQLIEEACRISSLRFDFHQIEVCCPILDGKGDGFHARFPYNLILGALSNIIDNAIYWLKFRYPNPDEKDEVRKLYIDVTHDFESGPAIVIADNGPGFQIDSLEYVTEPFFTHKPDGMGLGLFYARLVMEIQEGQLVFPQREEVEIPKDLDGAVVAMVFKEES